MPLWKATSQQILSKRQPEGEYIFLEVNPYGQYGWIEMKTGLPITQSIAELLREQARSA